MSSAQSATAPTSRSLFKDILQGSGIYSIAQILPTATSLLLVPITTRFLTPADYGIQDLMSQVFVVLSALLGWYYSVALGYFYFRAEPEARYRVVGTSALGALTLGLLACLVCYPAAGLLSLTIFPHFPAAPYLRLMFLLMPPSFVTDALMTWLRVANRPAFYVGLCALRAVVTVVFVAWFVGLLRMGIWGVLYSTAVSSLLTVLLLGAYWLVSEGPAFDWHLFLRMARYAAPLGLGGLAMFIMHFGDSFILPHFRPYDDLGLYRLAYKIAMMVSTIYGAFAIYWNAQVFQIMRRDDADTVFARLFTYVVLGTSFVSLGLIVCARPTLRKMAGPAFQDAWVLVPVLVIAYFFRSISEFMRSLFLEAGRPGIDAVITWLGAAVCIGAYAGLIPFFGVWGAAYATLIAFGVLAAIAIVWSYRLRRYRVEGTRLVKIAAATAATGGVWLLSRGFGSSFGALVLSAALSLTAYPLTLWVLRFPTPGELAMAGAGIQKVLRQRLK